MHALLRQLELVTSQARRSWSVMTFVMSEKQLGQSTMRVENRSTFTNYK